MAKVFKIFCILFIVSMLSVGVFYGIQYYKDKKFGVQEKEVEEFTVAWKKMKTEEEIVYIPNSSTPTKTERLLCGFSKPGYITLKVPERDTVNLFGSSVYAIDGSYSIIISDNVGGLNVASTIVDSMNLAPNIVCTKDGDDTVHVICKVFDNYTITAYVYSNSTDWSVIRDIIENAEIETKELKSIYYSTLSFEDIEKVGKETEPVGELSDTIAPKDLYMGNGLFRSMVYPITYVKAIEYAEKFMATMCENEMVYKYYSDEQYYIECNNYSICVLSSDGDGFVNIMFGLGDAAKANIKSHMM